MLGKIYIITNTKNDLVYVGSTTQSLHDRWWGHYRESKVKQCRFYRAIREIGWKHFNMKLLETIEYEEKSQLWQLEAQYITKYNSINNGYNSIYPIKLGVSAP